jgi:hypothetical protein
MSAVDALECVPGISIDKLMADCGVDYIDLLKMDVEGAGKEIFCDRLGLAQPGGSHRDRVPRQAGAGLQSFCLSCRKRVRVSPPGGQYLFSTSGCR